MADQKKRLEEVEKVAKDLQKAVQDVGTSVDGLKALMLSVETALVDHSSKFDAIMAKLDRLTPSSSFGSGEPKISPDSTSAINALPRMDLAIFYGSDPLAWLAEVEQYFLVHKTSKEQKVQLALIAMSDNALFWEQKVQLALIAIINLMDRLLEGAGDPFF